MRYVLIALLLATFVCGIAGSALGATYNVGDGGDLNAAVASANANPGMDTIEIAPGTIVTTAQVAITDDLTIVGAGADQTIIKPGVNTGGSGDARGWLLVGSAATLNISGVTLDGAGKNIAQAIRSVGGGTISNCAFENIRYANYNGLAISLFSNSVVADCSFRNIERIGIIAYGTGCTAVQITRCTYIGKGDVDGLDYAVEFGGGAVGSVSDCVIKDCIARASSDGSASGGIIATDYYGPGTAVTVTGCTISGCYYGIVVGYGSTDATLLTARDNNFTGNYRGVRTSSSVATVDAQGNWWGKESGPLPAGLGDWISGLVDGTYPLEKPAQSNALYLVPEDASVFIKPTADECVITLNVANLQQPVAALQAMLNFSSKYFKAGDGEVGVAAGGGIWENLIWDSWNTGGDLDVAVGIQFSLGGGTMGDAITAKFTLHPTGEEGVTSMVFRPDAVPDPGLTMSTFLSDMASNPIWPAKIDSTFIYIDGTDPEITAPADVIVSTDTGLNTASNVDLGEPTVSDDNSGVASVENDAPATFPLGVTIVTWTVTDRCGNTATDTQNVTVNDNEQPVVTSASASPELVKDQDVTITAAGTDNCTAPASLVWEHKVGDGEWKAGLVVANSDLIEGENTLYVQAKDEAGNWSDPFTVSNTVTKDTTAPAMQVISPAEGALINGTQVFVFDFDDANDLEYLELDIYRPAPYNTQADKYQVTLPARALTPEEEAYAASMGATVVYDAVEQKWTVTIDTTTAGVWPDGPYTWYIECGDVAGNHWGDMNNTSPEATRHWTMDNSAPVMELISPAEGAFINGTQVFVFDFDDANDLEYLELDIYRPAPYNTQADKYQVTLPARALTPEEEAYAASMGATVVYDAVEQKWTVTIDTTMAGVWPDGLYTWYIECGDVLGNHWGDMNNTSPEATRHWTIDNSEPSVAISALSGATASSGNFIQGDLTFTVDVDAAVAGLASLVVTVDGNVITPVGGVYTFPITSSTANGTHTIVATAVDNAGNVGTDTKTFEVNKNQITGQVELQNFVGASREVTFVATGASTKSYTLALSFSGGVAVYTLTDLPEGVTAVSAKTAWTLRNKLAVSVVDGQGSADFVGAEKLLGGDVNNSNSVNALDYTLLKINWHPTNGAAADINGDGVVNTIDYTILQSNFFKVGSDQ